MNDSSATQIVDTRGETKFLALVFGYMFLGLLTTALVAFGAAYGFFAAFYDASTQTFSDNGFMTMWVVLAVSFVAMFVTQIVLSFTMFKQKRGAWIPYLLYCAIMGIFFATFVMWMDWRIIGEAFGLTAAIFLIMFCIGYFTKVSLSPLAFVALSLLLGVCFISAFFGIWFLVSGTWLMYSYVASIIVIIAVTLIVGFDANRMKLEVMGGYVTKNTALYYAYSFYTDFIAIFMRILYVLALSQSKN
jgi:FtsH-binding integral membrane protein